MITVSDIASFLNWLNWSQGYEHGLHSIAILRNRFYYVPNVNICEQEDSRFDFTPVKDLDELLASSYFSPIFRKWPLLINIR